MASREGSRKRLKISRTANATSNSEAPPTASSSTATKDMAATNGAPAVEPNYHEQTLKALQVDIEAMRQLVTCKICDRLLYEPYSLSCGHTYCYSCLSQWLSGNHKKTCPDCRAITTQQPTPSYIIRELVLIFVSRSELLPDGETSDEHHALAREEAKIVSDDKANQDPRTGGLFKGCFSKRRERWMPMHDPGDGVQRCPRCHWELEDGMCGQCGLDVDDQDSLYGGMSDDLDISDNSSDGWGHDGQDDFEGQDDFDGDNSSVVEGNHLGENAGEIPPRRARPLIRPRHRRGLSPIDLRSTDDEDSSDEEQDPTMRQFIVDDDDQAAGAADQSGSDTDVPQVTRTRRVVNRRRVPIVISDDDEDDTAPPSTAADEDPVRRELDSDSESEDETPVFRAPPHRQQESYAARQRRMYGNYNDEASDDADPSSSEDEDDQGDHESSIAGRGGFSPLDMSAGDTASQRSNYDSDNASSIRATPFYDPPDYDANPYQGNSSENQESSSDSGEEDDNGWDTRSETPRPVRRPIVPVTQNHRLGTLGQRSNRHVDRGNNSHNTNGFFQAQAPTRSTRPSYVRDQWYGNNNRPSQNGQANQPTRNVGSLARPRPMTHPFQLGNTLAGINYNQRHQQARSSLPNQRTVSIGSSRGSGGGVGVLPQSSGSSGSSATVRGGDAGRRKRALSISSDVSYE